MPANCASARPNGAVTFTSGSCGSSCGTRRVSAHIFAAGSGATDFAVSVVAKSGVSDKRRSSSRFRP